MAVTSSCTQPFALSLSKGFPSLFAAEGKGKGFDKLSPNGLGGSGGE
jgi:hypothetical protein